jgi:RimJ/RimL family protein N-acetyltransferase
VLRRSLAGDPGVLTPDELRPHLRGEWPRLESLSRAVACSFFVGAQYEDIGVVSEPAERGRGLSFACAGALCATIQARGRQPSWSTSKDNTASLRVSEKLRFVVQRRDRLLVIGDVIDAPLHRRVGQTQSRR